MRSVYGFAAGASIEAGAPAVRGDGAWCTLTAFDTRCAGFAHDMMKSALFRQSLPHVLIVVLLIGIVVAGSRPDFMGDAAPRVLVSPPCRLDRGPCRATLHTGGWLELTVAPRPVPAGTPFVASLALRDVDVRQVELEFEGADMNMGLFRQVLAPRPTGGFEASVTLPICATGAMRWRTRLVVRAAGETLIASFDLITGEPSHAGG